MFFETSILNRHEAGFRRKNVAGREFRKMFVFLNYYIPAISGKMVSPSTRSLERLKCTLRRFIAHRAVDPAFVAYSSRSRHAGH